MPTKKTKKEVEEKKEKIAEKYFYAVGRRKSSVSQVRIYLSSAEENEIIINKKDIKDYFPTLTLQNIVFAPVRMAGAKFRITTLVKGGGTNGQAEATRLGIARALVKYDENLKKSLRESGFLTRDSRKVERKKPGLKKARRAPQFAKR
jgi:small subunit ribosomal protein S9